MKKSILLILFFQVSLAGIAQVTYKLTYPKVEVKTDTFKVFGNKVIISDKAGNQIINVDALDRSPGRVLTTDDDGVGRFVAPTPQAADTSKEDVSNKSISASLGTSNILYPSQNAVKSYVDNKVASYVSKTTADTTFALKTLTNGIAVSSGSGSILNVNSNGTYIGNVAQTTPTVKSALVTNLVLANPTTSVTSESNTNNITLDGAATSIASLVAKQSSIIVNNNSTFSPNIYGSVSSVQVGNRTSAYTGTAGAGRFIAFTSPGTGGQPNTQNWTNTALDGGIIGIQSYVSIAGGTGVTGTISNASGIASKIFTSSANLLITNGQNYASLNAGTLFNRVTNLRGYVSEEITAGVNNTNLLLGTSISPTGNWNIFSSSNYPNNLGNSKTTVGSLKLSVTPITSSSTNDMLVWNNATGDVEKIDRSSIFSSQGLTAANFRVSGLNTAPNSATDTGITGEIRYTDTHIYVCIANNTWVRAALTSW